MARLWEQHCDLGQGGSFPASIAHHRANVAHADLKPDNAFLIEDPSIAAASSSS
jgi:hypothetical protein